MRRPYGIWTGIAAAILVTGSSCSTMPDKAPPRPVYTVPMVPQMDATNVRLVEGRYPTLFEPMSTAVWVDAPQPPPPPPPPDGAIAASDSELAPVDPPMDLEPAAPPPYSADALRLRDSFLVIECRLASTFADQSIAYDAVGLRGINAILQLPDGREIPPSQVIIGSELLEAQRGALKMYGRTNLLLFPKDLAPEVVVGSGVEPVVRLKLSGHDSIYAFTWPADLSFAQEPGGVTWRKRKQEAERRLSNTREHIQVFLHNFD